MAFNPSSFPPSLRAEYENAKKAPLLWPSVVMEAARVHIKDEATLTNIVFFLHHPELNGRAIASHETKLVEEWKWWRGMVKKMIPNLNPPPKPSGPPSPSTPAVPDWVVEDTEQWRIRNDWGNEILDWVMLPPESDAEAKEFDPPSWLRSTYKTVFVWKSRNPKTLCYANPEQRVQVLAMVRDDLPYWIQRANQIGVEARFGKALQTGASTVIKDYRDLIVERKMCPKSAEKKLIEINREMIYQMLIGFYMWAGELARGSRGGGKTYSDGFIEIMKAVKKFGVDVPP
ncbi:MAG: hypothetical protein JNL98_25470 [Bryobacterales bacterium]|nr:hypothetical protein [Bryobacterales bacterium]